MAMADPARHFALKRIVPYELPSWARGYLSNEHCCRIPLANLPTPLHPIYPAGTNTDATKGSIVQKLSDKGIALFVKRDDMSAGVELGGNKIRKLEFLLADALTKGCDSVVTIGGEQSNHCRATAAASRMLGMEPHLILRTKRAQHVHEGKEHFGITGNILFDRIVGSKIYTCTPGEYGRIGSDELVTRVCNYLQETSSDCKPYGIPVGGSNGIGSFGYIQAVDELVSQWQDLVKDEGAKSSSVDHIVFACGSGGTAAGISVGIALAFGALKTSATPSQMPTVHAIGVCDNPDYFYKFVAKIADEMGLTLPTGLSTEDFIRNHLVVHQGKGLGYAISTTEELDFVSQFAQETGIALDPVYSGKALFYFLTDVIEKEQNDSFKGKNILFWHTGGALGLYDKESEMMKKLTQQSPVTRLDVYGKSMDGCVDISR